MICTFGDTTDVVWWRELAAARRAPSIGRDGRLLPRAARLGRRRAPRPTRRYAELAGKTVKQAQARIVELLARARRAGRRAEADHPPGEVLRAGRPSARDRDVAPVVHPQRRSRPRAARGVPRARARAVVAPDAHAQPLRELGRGPQLRLARSAASASSACRSRSGTRSTTTARSTTTTRSCPTRRACRSIPPATCPPGYTEDQRGKPGGFVADPDVMDTWATSSLTPADRRAAGRTTPTCSPACSRWTCARRRTRSSAPGCSPPSCAAHFEFDALPWTDAAISGWVLDPDRKKMSKSKGNVVTPMEPIRAVRRRRDALLGGERASRRRHRVRRGPDEGRPPARDQDPQRVEVRARRRSATTRSPMRRRGHRAARPLDARDASPRWSPTRPTSFDGYDYARALERTERFFWGFCDDYLELVKRSRRTRRVPTSARAALAARARHAAAAVRAAHAVRDRRGVVVVARGLGAPQRRGRAPTSSPAFGVRRSSRSTRRRPRCSVRSARRRARRSGRCAPR